MTHGRNDGRVAFGMRIDERLSSLGIRLPIFQAPVGSVAGPELAAAVSEAGGMGALALTWRTAPEARDAIAEVRARTKRPFQANFVLAFDTPTLDAALEAGVDVVTFSWGLPRREIAAVRAAGAHCGIQVTTVDGAHRALDLEPDFLICQGHEAGGHIQATRSQACDSVATLCFDGGWPQAAHRALDNSTIGAWQAAGSPPAGRRPGEGDAIATDVRGRTFVRYEDMPPLRGMTGDVEAMALYAGMSCGDVQEIASAGDVVARLWQECESARARRPQTV